MRWDLPARDDGGVELPAVVVLPCRLNEQGARRGAAETVERLPADGHPEVVGIFAVRE